MITINKIETAMAPITEDAIYIKIWRKSDDLSFSQLGKAEGQALCYQALYFASGYYLPTKIFTVLAMT